MRRPLFVALSAVIALLAVAPVQAQSQPVATITITDDGASPSTVTVAPGETVSWINQGHSVHTVTTDTGVAPTFDSGGLGPGQSYSHTFAAPGTFTYHSSTEPSYSYDSTGNAYTSYKITGTVVVASGAAAALAGPGTCQFVLGFKTLHDLAPAEVGDCVENQSFEPNGDAQQHTTKGLLAWRKSDNWTAFTNGSQTWINGPNGLVSRSNSDRFSWEHDTPATPAAPAAAPTPTPTQSPDPLVVIDDVNGFTPSYVVIQAGHTVTWINRGHQAHSVVNDNGNPPFDSSALQPGQQYSYNFTQPGGYYTYHSSTEPTHLYKNKDGVNTIGYQFTATIVVQ